MAGITRGGGQMEATLRGGGPQPAPMPQQTPQPTITNEGEPGDGTQQSGYVSPDLGPFECGNCTHFDGQGACDHPQVVSDPEVNGQVEAEGCCNFFKSAHNQLQGESQDEEQDELGGEQ